MDSSNRTLARTGLGAALAAALLVLPAVALAEQQQASPGKAGYAGEATCLSCHEAQSKGYHDTAHGRAWIAGSPRAGTGCESCHGPGQAHVDGSGDKTKIRTFTNESAADINEACQSCHTKGERALWDGSAHDGRGMSCTTCHSVHAPKSADSQLNKVTQQEVCVTCHRSQVQKLQRSAHMPVREGKMACSSCHNPHGATNVKLLKVGTSVNESCVSCHAEKRGPMLWEHAAVTESCTSCHDSHGSNNESMLVARQPLLCQRCHVTARHP
ncbi:MAG: DmsE family decaheme c-type cytochrome, partial [Acidobacteria bacterium]